MILIVILVIVKPFENSAFTDIWFLVDRCRAGSWFLRLTKLIV